MATFVLVPGAGGNAAYWHRLVPELRALGHAAVPVALPAADPTAGLAEYADTIVRAIGERTDVILVAQSLAGFSAPLACGRVPIDVLVLLNAMVPSPGETAGEWWATTGQAEARAEAAARDGRPVRQEFNLLEDFFHDVPQDVTAEAMAGGETPESDIIFSQPWPLDRWPDVPTRFLQGRDDRFFPLEFQRRVVKDRLGIPVDEMPGGHLLALSQPRALGEKLEGYRAELRPQSSNALGTRSSADNPVSIRVAVGRTPS